MQQRFTLDPGDGAVIKGLIEENASVWAGARGFVHEALAKAVITQSRGEFVALALPEPKEYANWRVYISDIARAESIAKSAKISMSALLCNAIRQYLPEAIAHIEEGVELPSYAQRVSQDIVVASE